MLTFSLILLLIMLIFNKPTYLKYRFFDCEEWCISRLRLWQVVFCLMTATDFMEMEVVPFWEICYNNNENTEQ